MQKKLKKQILEMNARGNGLLQQLRMGCLHPQLTRRWRERSHELQLNAVSAMAFTLDICLSTNLKLRHLEM